MSSQVPANSDKEEEAKIGSLHAKDIFPQHPEHWHETKWFVNKFVGVLLDYIREEANHESRVLEFHQPAEMARIIDLSIPNEPMSLAELLECSKKVLRLGVKSGHPRFFNQISCGLDLISMIGEWVAATCNTNMFTYEISPVFLLMEREVTRKMIDLIGWAHNEGDAIFAPGGTVSNLYAMHTARFKAFERVKKLGMAAIPLLCVFTSEDAHYSIKSAASVLGIGTDNCIDVATNPANGQMRPEELESKIVEAKGKATSGTTIYGAWDPLREIAEVCHRHGLWLHVDAAWGGGLLLSPEHRSKLDGIELADSVTWNPHKLMGSLLQCSCFFVRQQGLMLEANKMAAHYLFQQDKSYDVSFDTGDKVIQCGRHNDIFKLWLMWRSKGMEGYRQQINRLMQLADYFVRRIKSLEGFQMAMDEPQYLNICFWYVPPSMRQLPEKEKMEKLGHVAPRIKARMMMNGHTLVSYQPDKGRPNFFRMIISNQATKESDLDFLIEEITRLGADL